MEERFLSLRVCGMAIADTTFESSAFRQWVRWLLEGKFAVFIGLK